MPADGGGLKFGLPELPKLPEEAVKAINGSLPGQFLGRLAALIAAIALLIAFVALAVLGVRHVLGFDLTAHPVLFGAVLVLLALVVVTQQLLEWRGRQNTRRLQQLAVSAASVPAGFFRIGPYDDTPADRDAFDRADKAHDRVLAWLKENEGAPLYLTGQSGCGKSSLLQAAVVPALRKAGWRIVEARAWQDPAASLATALREASGGAGADAAALRQAIEAVAAQAKRGLLILLDQFEEFVILASPVSRQGFAALLHDLHQRPVPGLRLVLAFRSDYRPALDDLHLPPLRQGENWQDIGAFSRTAAAGFFDRSQLALQPNARDALLGSAASLDDLAGLVRPVTLNVVGHVLAESGGAASSLDASELIRRYLAQVVGAPALRDHAPRVVEHLLTAFATKQPRSEADLVELSGLGRGEVRAVLSALAQAGLARPLDAASGIWELSHDFVARAMARQLGQGQRGVWRSLALRAAPALLVLAMTTGAGALAWDAATREARAIAALAEFGLTVRPAEGSGRMLAVEPTSRFAADSLRRGEASLAILRDRIVSMSIQNTQDLSDIQPIETLKNLTTLDVSNTQVSDLKPIEVLRNLTTLDASGTQLSDFKPIEALKNLTTLSVWNTQVSDLKPIEALRNLTTLDVSGPQVSDLKPIEALKNLTTLDVSFTQASDLKPIEALKNLTALSVSGTQVIDLKPIEALNNLTSLHVSFTQVSDLKPIEALKNLTTLAVSNTQVSDLKPIEALRNLTTLYVSLTQVSDLRPIDALKNLTTLDVSGTQVSDLKPIKALENLTTISVSNTQVIDLKPIEALNNLTSLYASFTQVSDLKPIKALSNLTTLDVSNTQVMDLKPIETLKDLTALFVWNTQVSDLKPIEALKNLTSLYVSLTQVSDLKPIETLKDLTTLEVSFTQVSDLKPIEALRNLTTLDVSQTQVSDAERACFDAARVPQGLPRLLTRW